MSRPIEKCCLCYAPTGRAGAGDGSLYAGDYGPYCEDCWGDVPDKLAEITCSQQARIAELEALYDKAFSGSGGLLHRKELVRMLDERDAQLAELREAAKAEVDRQRHQCGVLRQELPPTTAALAALLGEQR